MSNDVDLHAELNRMEYLEEALADAQLQLEDRGWEKLGAFGNDDEFDREYLTRAARQCRASAIINPLIRRAVALRVAYVWGQGLHVQAGGDEDDGQDVNQVVQAFWDDPSNQASFTSSQAQEELERALCTDGNVFLALVTAPLSGRVQVRSIPFAEIQDIIRNPDDSDDVWFYQRTRTVARLEAAPSGLAFAPTQTETVYHPAAGYRPRQRPKTIDGHPILWDQPVTHVSVNRLDGWKYGIGDVYTAISWARGYSEFLQDWAKLMRALAKVAWQASAKTKAGAANVRQRVTGQATEAGSLVVTGAEQKIEAVSKSGATIDANSGRPLASMVAAATDLPVTMLLSDPGVTGARATAETLDRPLELLMMMRQKLWAHTITTVLDHVIDSSVRAPQGMLRGTIDTDPVTGNSKIVLLNDAPRLVEVAFPPLDQQSPEQRIAAIAQADGTDKLPPELVARLLMQALDVDNVDDLMKQLLDDNGQWVDPMAAAAARSALNAVAGGDFPTDQA